MNALLRGLRALGDDASACAGGDAAACARYYSTVYASAPSVVAARDAQQSQQQSQIDEVAQGDVGTVKTWTDYPQAPGCHVVDLANNLCLLDNGQSYGCNSIQECDPLTTAVHTQNPLPTPANPLLPALKTGATPTPADNAPVLGLPAPTGGTVVTGTETAGGLVIGNAGGSASAKSSSTSALPQIPTYVYSAGPQATFAQNLRALGYTDAQIQSKLNSIVQAYNAGCSAGKKWNPDLGLCVATVTNVNGQGAQPPAPQPGVMPTGTTDTSTGTGSGTGDDTLFGLSGGTLLLLGGGLLLVLMFSGGHKHEGRA